MARWRALIVLSVTQFLMVLDQSVMNVSISQLVEDFDTTVSSIQAVITLYSLVMAALMITGGKIGDIIGRRRALVIGLVIYGSGSALTAASWSVGSLAIGWSILEGIGAALVLPAMAALIAGNYEGKDRVTAYGVLGGMAGAGIAIGPILGGWATTNLSWRVVFIGEVIVALAIILTSRWIVDVASKRRPQLDVVGAVLSAAGMAIAVLGVLQSSTWGWLDPLNSPVEPFGFALTPFVIAAGIAVLYAFKLWSAYRVRQGLDPLVDFALFRIDSLRAGLSSFVVQNTVLMGIFFALPLYLQIVLGLNALDTGVRMLPTSIVMFAVSFSGAMLLKYFGQRTIIRMGLGVLLLAGVVLLGTIEPTLDGVSFGLGMALLGAGMGLIASQLGNVVLSSVDAEARSEAGGLQYTAQQLGSSLGVALIGSIVLTGLGSAFINQIEDDPDVPPEVTADVEVALSSGVNFVASEDVAVNATEAGLAPETVDALVDNYEEAQLLALKAGLLAVIAIAGLGFLATGGLPNRRDTDPATSDGGGGDFSAASVAEPANDDAENQHA
ncbi:MAG: MFS transporter [Actinomycetota bacterium]